MTTEDQLHRAIRRRTYSAVQRDALRIIEQALERFGTPAVVAVSGGKDSVAMAHLVVYHMRHLAEPDPVLLHTDSGLELRESRPVCERLADVLGVQLHVAKGADAAELKREMGKAAEKVEDELCIIRPAREALAELGAKVEFVGLRMAESKRRHMLIGSRGPVIDNKRYGCGVAWPMRSWSGADVFAYCDEYDLPLHPAYSVDLGTPRNERRVSWAYDSSFDSKGAVEFLRRYDPALYHRLQREGVLCSAR